MQKTAEPVIDHIADENRDPKVYWHENSQAYYMVLFWRDIGLVFFVLKIFRTGSVRRPWNWMKHGSVRI